MSTTTRGNKERLAVFLKTPHHREDTVWPGSSEQSGIFARLRQYSLLTKQLHNQFTPC